MPKTKATKPLSGNDAARFIDAKIAELGDWRGEALSRARTIIMNTDRLKSLSKKDQAALTSPAFGEAVA